MARKANPTSVGDGGAAVLNSPGGLIDHRDSRPKDDCPEQPIDPRLVFLARADARLYLVEHGFMSLAEAVAGLIDLLEAMAPFLEDVPLSPGGAP